MRILLASSEVHPYSKTGGLADMTGALAKALARAGHQVGMVTPLYRGIREKFPDLQPFDYQFDLPLGERTVHADVMTFSPAANETVYFVNQPEFYQRPTLYQANGVDFPDNAERFIFFSKCVAHLARYLPWQPEIVHLHDWQTGLVPVLMLDQTIREGWSHAPRTCLTVHNLAYQGQFPRAAYELTNLPREYFTPSGVAAHGGLNCLKAALVYANIITTVSPRYAREICTEEYGCGLDAVLRARQAGLRGILNGVDYDEWNTQHNPFLPHHFSARNLTGKTLTKLELQREFGLPENAAIPLFGTVTRLADQKGMDVMLGALEEMLAAEMQFVLLGSGSPEFESAFQLLAHRHPTKVAVRIGYDQALSHRVEAGCDFFLMPSRFEPCGLNQMYSHRYGTIPIVRLTGGLDDSVVDLNEDTDLADGIKFTEYSFRALAKAIRKALVLYATPRLLHHFRQNGMNADFSWTRTTEAYTRAYREAQSATVI